MDANAILKSGNDQVKLLKTEMKQGNNDAAAVTLKEMGQYQQGAVQSKSGLQAPLVPSDSMSFDVFNLRAYLEGVSPSQLFQTEQTLESPIDNNDIVVDFLEHVHESVSSIKSGRDGNKVGGK